MPPGYDWVEITPETVSIDSLQSCRRHLQQLTDYPAAIFFAAVDANRALQAALTAALAGSANIGASPPKIRGEWLQWFELNRQDRPSITPSWRVMGVRDMLTEAINNPLPWGSAPLQLSARESFFISRLLFYRDSFEHPKQLTFLMTRQEIADAIGGSVDVCERALQSISHQLDDQLNEIAALVVEIKRIIGQTA